jgi:putative membrane protein
VRRSSYGANPRDNERVRHEGRDGDMMEIQSSQFALERQPDADTKPFAERMITDHQETSEEFKTLVDGGKVKALLATGLDAEHQKSSMT